MYKSIPVYMCVCMYVCMYVCMFVCIYLYIYIYTLIYIDIRYHLHTTGAMVWSDAVCSRREGDLVTSPDIARCLCLIESLSLSLSLCLSLHLSNCLLPPNAINTVVSIAHSAREFWQGNINSRRRSLIEKNLHTAGAIVWSDAVCSLTKAGAKAVST